jgi:hypothetical protein
MTAQEQRRESAIAEIKKAMAGCEGTFVPRDKVESLTNGAISSKWLANLDCLGKGPKGAFKVGRKQCYPIDSLTDWLISRLEV